MDAVEGRRTLRAVSTRAPDWALVLAVLACIGTFGSWFALRRSIREVRAELKETTAAPEAAQGWLKGSSEQKFLQVEGQLRGFDKTMVEVSYRYTELYFAGRDRNWPYADYQAEKLAAAIGLGLERRPKRAASARHFLDEDLPAFRKALEERQPAKFDKAFLRLRQACIRCHARESVPHFAVTIPERRIAPIRLEP